MQHYTRRDEKRRVVGSQHNGVESLEGCGRANTYEREDGVDNYGYYNGIDWQQRFWVDLVILVSLQ